MDAETKVYAIYVRVSTSEQAHEREGSISSQIQRCREFLQYKFGQVQAELFREDGKSGKDTNRPEFNRLTDAIQAGKVLAVVCTELSRISRSVVDFHTFLNVCNAHNTGFISLREQFDTTTAQGKLMLSIFASVAQFEREQISERTSANMQARARRGLFNGGMIYGYRPRPNQKGYLDADPHEAVAINIMYDKYLECGSFCKVTAFINNSGYRTREYTSRNGLLHQSKKFNPNTVYQILRNPAYSGKKKVGKETIQAVWPAIIAEEKFNAVQELFEVNHSCCGNTSQSARHVYLFGGLIHCKSCGIKYENNSGTGNSGNRYFYYRHEKTACDNSGYLPEDTFDPIFYRCLSDLLRDQEIVEMVCEEISLLANKDISSKTTEIKYLDEEIRKAEETAGGYLKKIPLLPDNQVREMVTPILEDLATRKKTLSARKIELEWDLNKLQSSTIHPEEITRELAVFVKRLDEVDGRDKQKLTRLLVQKLEIGQDGEVYLSLYVYNQKERERLNYVRELPNWLPVRNSRRTVCFRVNYRYTKISSSTLSSDKSFMRR